jgi:putative protease
MDNELGGVVFEAGTWWLEIRKLRTVEGKELSCIHSGDLRAIMLPTKLPGYTMLRRDIREAKANKGLRPDPSGHQRNTPKGEEKQ